MPNAPRPQAQLPDIPLSPLLTALLTLTLTPLRAQSPSPSSPSASPPAATAPAASPAPAELAQLRAAYEKDLAARVTGPFETALAELNTKFITALDRAAADAKKAGLLDLVLAILDDKRRLTEKAPIPDDLPETPDAIKKLRAIYRAQLAKITDQRAKNHALLLPPHTTKLQALEVALTRSDRIQDAKTVRDYRLSLAAPPAIASAPDTPPVPGQPPIPPSPPDKSADPPAAKNGKSTGDDRLATEWLLSIGASARIDQRGKMATPSTAADLPKSPFLLTGASLKGGKPGSKITAPDLLRLQGLTGLKSFDISDHADLTDPDFSFLKTCPSLEYVGFTRLPNLTDAAFLHLAKNPNIRSTGGTDLAKVTGTFLGGWKDTALLDKINFLKCGINDAGLSHLARFPKITSIALEGCSGVTDASLPAFAKLPKLTSLQIQGTSITAPALAAAKLKITALDCNWLNHQPLRETAPIIGPAYPDVGYIRLTRSEAITGPDLAALVHFKGLRRLVILMIKDASALTALAQVPQLTSLTIDRKPFTDADIPHLLAIPQLTSLHLLSSDITDTGLLQLANHKNLEKLELTNAKTTPAGLAALKKLRPKLKIED